MMETKEKIAQHSGTFTIGADLKVYRLGFGAMRVTGSGIWGDPPSLSDAIKLLKTVPTLGINLIDTADAYGPEVSENLIAEALYPYPSELVIATKGGLVRPGPNQWEPNGRPEHLRDACEGSLKRLRLDCIDLYQLHRIDPNIELAEQLGALVELQMEGKIKHIGLSEVSVKEIKAARQLANIATVQNKYNLLQRESEEVLNYCTQENIGFIPWFPLNTGELTHANNDVLNRISRELHAKPSQVALAWLLAKAKVMLPIPGTSNIVHLRENTASALLKLDKAQMDSLNHMVKQ